MNKLDRVKAVWMNEFIKASKSQVMQSIVIGDITTEQYASVLCEIYHQVRRHPAALAAMGLRLRGKQIDLVPGILRHALSETGHDDLALDDLETLGYSREYIKNSKMLPETAAILGYMDSLLLTGSPLSFLGYLFHLEFMPTASGAQYIEGLKKAGIPEAAVSFIKDHSVVDIGHNKLMEKYLEVLPESAKDIGDIEAAAETTIQLYANLLKAAMHRPLSKSSLAGSAVHLGC